MNNVKAVEVKPNSNYKDKYAHLIGQDAAVEAAKKTETNKSYGFGEDSMIIVLCRVELLIANVLEFCFAVVVLFSVPSKNKRDMRTIEDVQADIQAKKKMKLSQTVTSSEQLPNTQ